MKQARGHIVRIDSAPTRTHGYQARIATAPSRQQQRLRVRYPYRSRLFSDVGYGGRTKAKKAAERWLARGGR